MFPVPHFSLRLDRTISFLFCNAPSTLQRITNDLLRPYGTFTQNYVEDIVIYSSSVEEHAEHLSSVFQLFRSENLYSNQKCTFGAQSS